MNGPSNAHYQHRDCAFSSQIKGSGSAVMEQLDGIQPIRVWIVSSGMSTQPSLCDPSPTTHDILPSECIAALNGHVCVFPVDNSILFGMGVRI